MDPIISDPLSSQAVNPYSYIGNNPLSGTDPTGYCAEGTEAKTGSHICQVTTEGAAARIATGVNNGSITKDTTLAQVGKQIGAGLDTVKSALGGMADGLKAAFGMGSGADGASGKQANPSDPSRVNDPASTATRSPDTRMSVGGGKSGGEVRVYDGAMPATNQSPIDGDFRLTSGFGDRVRNGSKEWHPGMDLAAPAGTRTLAMYDGVVVWVEKSDWGGWVAVKSYRTDGSTFALRYMHNGPAVGLGQVVHQGDALGGLAGSVPNPGFTNWGPHLHLEFHPGGSYLRSAGASDFVPLIQPFIQSRSSP